MESPHHHPNRPSNNLHSQMQSRNLLHRPRSPLPHGFRELHSKLRLFRHGLGCPDAKIHFPAARIHHFQYLRRPCSTVEVLDRTSYIHHRPRKFRCLHVPRSRHPHRRLLDRPSHKVEHPRTLQAPWNLLVRRGRKLESVRGIFPGHVSRPSRFRG